ncbi:MAG: serine/threonine protein kinase [Leptolyngbyaceae cyanobacterium CRU_2_3]|nr:serine/threonine protein kinase [Leptolyngbyaceae cyanobacterium CRU_2_3]
MTDTNVGRTLQNRYRLSQLLGQGSMGRVYGAEDVALGGVPVAIKFLSQALLNRKMRDRFEREAKTCAQLGQRSIHIVRVTNYGIDEEGIPFYVMEYLHGESLSDIISSQAMPIPRFLSLARQVCLGLQCAHQGILVDGKNYPIVHRDIKPSNVLVSQDESLGELAKILDFGIAKVLQDESSQTHCFMGTLAYSSPEQMEGRELDARSDIYSLGVMLFQMLTGQMPLHADTHSFGGWYKAHHFYEPQLLSTANSDTKIPKALENLVMSCLAKAASDRPQAVSEILKALEPLEDRFGTGRQIAQRIGASLSRLPIAPTTPKTPDTLSSTTTSNLATASSNDLRKSATWPKNMPIAEIVFPKPMSTSNGKIPTLWVMLPQQEIEKRLVCTRYNQFLFLEAPHPMALWLTVLYNREHEPRWLPCFLDLKTSQGRHIASLLGQTGQYRIMFFAQENPQQCANVQTATIAAAQCKLLQDWSTLGQVSKASPNPTISKDYLRSALDNIKPQILIKLESIYSTG